MYKIYNYKLVGLETEETYETIQEANDEAIDYWSHLTPAEQKQSHVFVGTANHELVIPEGAFDSRDFVAKLVWRYANEVE